MYNTTASKSVGPNAHSVGWVKPLELERGIAVTQVELAPEPFGLIQDIAVLGRCEPEASADQIRPRQKMTQIDPVGFELVMRSVLPGRMDKD